MPCAVNILASGLRFPEGPVFDREGRLWAVELKGDGLVCWQNGRLEKIATGGAPNGSALDRHGRVVFCDSAENAIRRYDPSNGHIETLASQLAGATLDKPNDLAFDAAGNLVFTCPGNSRQEPTGYMCVMTPDGGVRKVADGMYFPNGLAFAPGGGELIVAETYQQRLWRGRWNAERAEWENPRVWAEGLDGAPGPDGMAFGEDGLLHVAVYGAGAIFVLGPDGAVQDKLPLPGNNPTNCAFDPSGVLGLVVTEAEKGLLLSLPARGKGLTLYDGKS